MGVGAVEGGQYRTRVGDFAGVALNEGAPTFGDIFKVLKGDGDRLIASGAQIIIALLAGGAGDAFT